MEFSKNPHIQKEEEMFFLFWKCWKTKNSKHWKNWWKNVL